MTKVRTIVVDDEALARMRIINLLKQVDFIDLVSDCKNGREAIRDIKLYKPDLILLDIQMPEFNGFEVIEQIGESYHPFIIFVTAFGEYALKAFDVHAVDYLLKPFDDKRFYAALNHAKDQIKLKKSALLNNTIHKLLDDHKQEQIPKEEFLYYHESGQSHKIKLSRILYVKSDGNYIRIIMADKKLLIRDTMQSMQDNLSTRGFLRIHRSFLVNKDYIDQIFYVGNNQYKIQLNDGQVLMTGRKYKQNLDLLKSQLS
jgi:two-component system LytT family response regulator